ncbi:NUDIX domain-containing protein [Sphingomonas sp. LHG3406-1]|uniref:NUDIX domain-containing protein n=1 Tax=Sphingomonas sp. LHG3406-1 TaxID=2804617 RepID=UPI002616907D|nr:NUDIX domain-containing protein [Sphingomonas sp. LHG3406-1]
MPQARSAGILLYRRRADLVEVLLGHPGGPYWARKDEGAWMVPKGAIEPGEDALEAAQREFAEEVGPLPPGMPEQLHTVRQNGGKLVEVFALEGDFDPAQLSSEMFELEWPPRSGRTRRFPELDRVEWMELARAHGRILKSQRPVLDVLAERLGLPAAAAGQPEQDQPGEAQAG